MTEPIPGIDVLEKTTHPPGPATDGRGARRAALVIREGIGALRAESREKVVELVGHVMGPFFGMNQTRLEASTTSARRHVTTCPA